MKKIYKVIFEDCNGVYREYIPADNVKQLKEQWGGNGDIVSIQDITEDTPIYLETLRVTLIKAGYGEMEIDIIIRTLQNTLENTI